MCDLSDSKMLLPWYMRLVTAKTMSDIGNNSTNNIENESRTVEKASKDRLSSYSEDPLQKETQAHSQLNPNVSVKIV